MGAMLVSLVTHGDGLFRKSVARSLISREYRVDEAADGSSAWAMMRRRAYDLVVMDMQLSDISGLEMLRLMRRLEWSPSVLVTFDWYAPAIEKMAFALGADKCCLRQDALIFIDQLIDRLAPARQEGCTPIPGSEKLC